MSNKTRRGCIATMGVLLSSGCLGSTTTDTAGGSSESEGRATSTRTPRPDSDGDGVVDSYDDYPVDPNRSRLVESVSDTRNVEEDHYYYYPLSLNRNGYVEMEYVVREGPDIDVIFLSSAEFEHFEAGENYLQYDSLSQWDGGGGSISGPIRSGRSYVVFHNANAPTNFSNDLARVEFEIEVSE